MKLIMVRISARHVDMSELVTVDPLKILFVTNQREIDQHVRVPTQESHA